MESKKYTINFDKNPLLIKKKLNIHNYISEFLLRHETIILPGLGKIKKIRTEARLEKGEIRPPGSKLIFTSEESADDDNLLAKDIAEGEDISLEEANQRILEFIDDIKFAFNKGEAFTIEGVCTLSLDENNNVRLDQDTDFIGDPENYGLDSLEFKDEEKGFGGEKDLTEDESEEEKEFHSEKMAWVLDEEQDMHKFEETYVTGGYIKKEQDEKSSEKKEIKDKVEPQSEKIMPEEEPPPPPPAPPYSPTTVLEMRKRSVRRRLNIGLTIVGVAILIVAAFILIPIRLDFFENEINFDDIFGTSEEMEVNDDFSDIKDEEFDFDEMVDDMEKDLDSASKMEHALDVPDETGEEAQPGAAAERAQAGTATEEEYVEYHIIAGSFRDYENAKELQQELTMLGYPSLLIEPRPGIYRVSAISYKDKVTALNKLVEFREKTGMETAWLMNLE